jgi:1,4-dihydroxy-2-naphthoate octaprenyltransferase
LSAGTLSWGFADRIEAENAILYGVFVFCGIFTVYNLQRIFKVTQASVLTPWLVWVKENQNRIIILSILSALGAVIALAVIQPVSIASILILLITGLFGFFYVVRVGGKNLRAIPFFKIHVISITWSLLIAVFPWIEGGSSPSVLMAFFAHYLFILAITIPFDIRDLKYDDKSYKTIPQVLGVKRSKQLTVLLMMVYIVLIQFIFPSLLSSPWFWITMLVIIGLITAVNEEVSDWYCAGIIDGSIGLLGLVYLLA